MTVRKSQKRSPRTAATESQNDLPWLEQYEQIAGWWLSFYDIPEQTIERCMQEGVEIRSADPALAEILAMLQLLTTMHKQLNRGEQSEALKSAFDAGTKYAWCFATLYGKKSEKAKGDQANAQKKAVVVIKEKAAAKKAKISDALREFYATPGRLGWSAPRIAKRLIEKLDFPIALSTLEKKVELAIPAIKKEFKN